MPRPGPVRLLPSEPDPLPRAEALVESYRGLADVFHQILAVQSLDALLEQVADTVGALVPYDALHIYEADNVQELLVPVHVRSEWAYQILGSRPAFGEGITGWAVVERQPVWTNAAHLDPRVRVVPGTPVEAEALISVPLVARDVLKGALNIYRIGEEARFDEVEFELAKRFGDAAALALDNAQIRTRLEHQAQTDSLTGLYNHRYFHERLRTELLRASRTHDPVSVLMLDIDDFKLANDAYGHAAGDDILVRLAEVLRSTARGSDTVCRLGGEEFALVMPGADTEAALALASRITSLIGSHDFGPSGGLTLSLGVAEGPAHASNPRELVACAEAAMMTAKARGKNRIVSFGDGGHARPHAAERGGNDVQSLVHLKMLQSLAGKLSRLTDLHEIGLAVADELRSLIDYHNCRVFVVDGEMVVPIAFRGELAAPPSTPLDVLKFPVGHGVTGHVVETGESLLVRDAARCEFAVEIPGTDAIDESLLAVPLRHGSRRIGAIVVSKLGFDQFDEADLRLVQVLAAQVAVAVENACLFEAQRREAESAQALLTLARELSSARGLEDVLQRTVDLTARIVGAEETSLWLEDAAGELEVRATAVRDPWVHAEGRRLLEPVRRPSPDNSSRDDGAATSEQRRLVAPFGLADGTRGCLVVRIVVRPGDSPSRQLTLLDGVAHQAKLAIANASNVDNLEGTFISTVEVLAAALDANGNDTSRHARWIAETALRVGRHLGLDADALRRLELGALFHDIGKIGIPAEIIAKPGPLTDEERVLIEQHQQLGERIIGPVSRLQDVRRVVRHCRERYDGRGYPDGLAAAQIPIESRIVFVCEAFHAMTRDRPHRKALPHEEARRRLRAEAGAQFDPVVAETFLSVLDETSVETSAA